MASEPVVIEGGKDQSTKLDELLAALIEVMAGDFDVRLPITGENDVWDGIHSAINITVEELGIRARKLQESERRFRLLFEEAGIPAFITDTDYKIVRVNQACADYLGYDPRVLRRRDLSELAAPSNLQTLQDTLLESKEAPKDVEAQFLKADGSRVWARTTLTWLRSDQREYPCLLLTDLTERRSATQALREREALFEALSESASDAIVLYGPTGRIVEVNQAACAMLGYDRKELFELQIMDLEPEWADPGVARSGTVLTGIRTAGGDIVPVEATFSTRDIGGLQHVLVIARDVSERVRHQVLRDQFVEGVVAAQEDERGRVARELHDALGQLLTGLQVRLGTLQQRAPKALQDELGAILSMTETAILEVGTLAHHLRPPVLDDLGFVETVHECARTFTQTHNIATDVHIRGLDAEERLNKSVEIALYRIIQEALNNTARHAQASVVSILLQRTPDEIKLIVEDDGRGFEIDEATGFSQQTNRLGLPGIRERATLLGGGAKFESRPGAGTSVYVTLPMKGHEGTHSSSGRR